MKKTLAVAVILAALFTPFTAYPAEKKTADGNPLKEEMRLLQAAYFNLIESLVLNKLDKIEEPFHAIHRAKDRTHDALEKGEIKLPKNHDKTKHFETLDKKFHKNLEALMVLAKSGDKKSVEILTHRLLNACMECHGKFRN